MFIAIIQVINNGGIKVDGGFHQTKAQNVGIEMQICLGCARHGLDVIEPVNGCHNRMIEKNLMSSGIDSDSCTEKPFQYVNTEMVFLIFSLPDLKLCA